MDRTAGRTSSSGTSIALHRDYDPLLGLKESAEYLSISPVRLRLMASMKEIAVVRAATQQGSPLKFRLSALNAWVKSHEIKPLRAAR